MRFNRFIGDLPKPTMRIGRPESTNTRPGSTLWYSMYGASAAISFGPQ